MAPEANEQDATGGSIDSQRQLQPDGDANVNLTETPATAATAGFTSIVVTDRPFRDYADEAAAAFVAVSEAQRIYRRGGQFVTIVDDELGNPIITPITRAELPLILSRAANFYKVVRENQLHVPPPAEVINNLLSRRDLDLPDLVGITMAPILRRDGTVLTVPGWDQATGLFYEPSNDIAAADWDLGLSSEAVASAMCLIEDLLADFPFENCGSKANAFALLLTAVVRPVIDGCVPLALVNGTNPGTGKGLLTSVASLIATGTEASVEAAPQGDDEWRKKITTALKAGRTFIVFDNFRGTLKACPLEAALTSSMWSDRLLGTNDDLSIRQRATWVATGNNVALGTDMARRCYQIRFTATSSMPWRGKHFRHPQLLGWVRQHRGDLLKALLTLAGSWFSNGCPAADIEPLGSFEDWTLVVGGILQHAGVRGFLENLTDMYDEASAEQGEWESFLRLLKARFGQKPFTVAEVVEAAFGTASNSGSALLAAMPSDLSCASNNSLKLKLGKAFSARLNTRFGEDNLHLARRKDDIDRHTKAARWRVLSDTDQQLKVVA